jgi:hypothetical protein
LEALKECFSRIPGLEIVAYEQSRAENEPELYLKIRLRGKEQLIGVEARAQGTPKSIRSSVNQLTLAIQKNPSIYGMVIAPFISPQSAQICEAAGIGYLDLSGNCQIAFQEVYIHHENFPNRYPYKSEISSLYAPKSERVLRVLLTHPYRPWKTLELAQEAQVSSGMITHIRKKLDEQELITSSSLGFQLVEPHRLLRDWSENYSYRKNTILEFYSLETVSDVEQKLDKYCDQSGIRYALTGFSAADRLAPMVRNQRVMVYLDQTSTHLLVTALNLKPVSSGANVNILNPYDEGVYWHTQRVAGIEVATPVQVYMDLVKNRGRGEEAAEFLYNEVLLKSWQPKGPNTASFK